MKGQDFSGITMNGSNGDYSLERLVSSNSSIRILAYLILAMFASFFILIFILPWQQTSFGTGRVVAFAPLNRQQFIEAPIEGRIVHWHVMEGSVVKKGDSIVEISDNDPNFLQRLQEEKSAVESRIAAVEARAESFKARIRALEASMDNGISAAKSRTRMSGDRVDAALHAVEAAESVYKTASLNLKRQRTLASSGLASTRAVEMAEMEEARALTDLNRAKASLSASKSEEIALKSDQFKVGTDAGASIADARASYAAAIAELSNAKAELPRISARLARQHSQSVVAPRDGTIMRLIVSQDGEMVKAGEPLALLIPDSPDKAAEIWIEGNDIPLVVEGQRGQVQFQGFPALQFSGWPGISAGTFSAKVVLVDNTDNGTGKFRILLKPDRAEDWPSGLFLKQGVQAHAWIFLNEVSLAYEMWRRFNDFPPDLPYDPSHSAVKSKDKKDSKK
ncbi:MAG TPA: HlyD family efflux transporter periplasmic adaptor subunit [Leptospiraceae bacterium]|nr:HlyD family efflux transporter periplasmic adaptor subunit [Leptospiraceae bacterium]HRG73042.1 HlyD family efflux transporter periplasmic adaptor subunit [Leptospiraceae bacterium]